jgi:hypothetical protein
MTIIIIIVHDELRSILYLVFEFLKLWSGFRKTPKLP